jgi:hypothetical protein
MLTIRRFIQHSRLAVLVVLCLAALTATSVYAGGVAAPLRATDILGSPDAAVNGKLAVGSSSVGNKSLTVAGVIDFVGAGTVHNYFTQGTGNNMQINSNIDEANVIGDTSKAQWKMVMGAPLDQFSIRRSPSGSTYNEDALFWIDGSTGDVGIATVDTGNQATFSFTPKAKLDVRTSGRTAVSGESSATNGIGLYGSVTSTASSTVGSIGVFAESLSPTGTALLAENVSSTGALAGQFNGHVNISEGLDVTGSVTISGDLDITGAISKGSGTFRIDDPLDPTHKYLQHSFVESPDMMNVYNGNVTLDGNGEAVVTMPDWFQALNQDFRYQLTPMGAAMPDLHLAGEIANNHFSIAGGSPGGQVSWQVTGIRHDPYAEANRIQVLVDKPASEQGTYLYPELYSQP